MATKRTITPPPAAPARPPYMLIEEIRVQGYKSLVDATLHVRPLTLLAGANSSGKSSIMQPLLLIKQTMEAPYQPAGALVLDGAHVQAETAGELLTIINSLQKNIFSLGVNGRDYNILPKESSISLEVFYQKSGSNFLIALQQMYLENGAVIKLDASMKSWDGLDNMISDESPIKSDFNEIIQANGFLHVDYRHSEIKFLFSLKPAGSLEQTLGMLFHIPGLRSTPKRSYPTTFFKEQIKGTFDLYTAGTISQWQQENNTEALTELNYSLQRLGLTNSITAKVKNANEVELSVNRLPSASKAKPRKADMVNIADVGIGVSQVLPILVALIAAQEGQIVYVEQPELHLHPKAQVEMAHLLASAAKRGVRVIVETHSSLLLLTVQTLVAEGELTPKQVGLHWFERDARGATKVTLAEVDENGAYGTWPEDFGDVELTAQARYLDAQTMNNINSSGK